MITHFRLWTSFGPKISWLVTNISTYDFMGVKYSPMFIQIKTLRGLEMTARWVPLPISMVHRSEGSLKTEMLSLVRTSKYVNKTVCKSKNSEEDSFDWSDSPNWAVIVVIDSYSCFLIELLCQTKTFVQFERPNRVSRRLHKIDWL